MKPEHDDVAGHDISLIGLMVAAALGLIFIGIFSFVDGCSKASLFALAVMSAGAAGFSGGLVGFLFGVPHSRDQDVGKPGPKDGDLDRSGMTPSLRYKPNTSLEQISDWLSKIIVGVGLVEIKTLINALKNVGQLLANGFNEHVGAGVFFTAILIYYLVCGFVFGFLWARIYLRRWFEVADSNAVRKLNEEVSDIKSQLQRDASAFGLISAQLSRGPDDEIASDDKIAEAIKEASVPVKIQIFNMAERASRDKNVQDYPLRVETAISIFRGLIRDDTDGRFHRNFSELSYALRRRVPPSLQEATDAISKAIQARERSSLSGWRYYEFSRARNRIGLDENFKNNQPSTDQNVSIIRVDLEAATSEPLRWKRWLADCPEVGRWMKLNNVNL